MTWRKLMAATVLAALTGTALAGDDCAVPMARWQTRNAVRAMAEARGWNLKRIKIHDGCYEVYARDTSGKTIEAHVDPATLAVVSIEDETDHDDQPAEGETPD